VPLYFLTLQQYHQLSYEELAFHLDDSSAFRSFSRLEMGQCPCRSILQENIKSLAEGTFSDYKAQEIIKYIKTFPNKSCPSNFSFHSRFLMQIVILNNAYVALVIIIPEPSTLHEGIMDRLLKPRF
jgi:hypothetical protein